MTVGIRLRMILYIVPVVILVSVSAAVIVHYMMRGLVQDLAYEKSLETARQYANQVDVEVNSHLVILQTLAHVLETERNWTREEIVALLRKLMESDYNTTGMGVLLPRGSPAGSGTLASYWHKEGEDAVLQTMTGSLEQYDFKSSVSNYLIQEPALRDDALVLRYVVPIRSGESVVGAVVLDISVAYLNELINDIGLFRTGYAFLTSNRGMIVTFRDDAYVGSKTLEDLSREKKNPELLVLRERVANNQEGFLETVDPMSGRDAVMFYSPVRTSNWGLVTVVPRSEMLAGVDTAVRLIAVVGVVSLTVLVLLLLIVTERLATPIRVVATRMDQADLNTLLRLSRADEIGKLAGSFDRFVLSLRETLQDVTRVSAQLAQEGQRISQQTDGMARDAHEQAAMSGQIHGSIEELSRTVQDIARNAANTRELAHHAQQRTDEGTAIIEDTTAGVNRMVHMIKDTADVIESLSESSTRIERIISLIEDITRQVNLIALNASVEAVKAGERGKGFGVVADEIKKLADKTSRATTEISDTIHKIQSGISGAVVLMRQSKAEGDAGIRLANEARTSLKEISEVFRQVSQMVNHIAEGTHAHSGTNQEIAERVRTITGYTEAFARGTQEIARSTEYLRSLTEQLEGNLAHFKMDGAVPLPKD
jgi:methyl-accepting chemotaxis protein